MKTQNKIINLKPIEVDSSFKYICPVCENEHWVFLRQVKYNKFVLVCECGNILKPKTIESLKVIYKKRRKKILDIEEATIGTDLLNRCSEVLIKYGFNKKEAEDLVKNAYISNTTADCSTLVKMALSKFGEKNG